MWLSGETDESAVWIEQHEHYTEWRILQYFPEENIVPRGIVTYFTPERNDSMSMPENWEIGW